MLLQKKKEKKKKEEEEEAKKKKEKKVNFAIFYNCIFRGFVVIFGKCLKLRCVFCRILTTSSNEYHLAKYALIF